MRSKRGQIFGAMLVFSTLFLCLFVMGLYYVQQKSVQNSLVSPRDILEIRDNLKEYRITEMKWACLAYDKFGKNEDELKDEFCSIFSKSDEVDFLFSRSANENWVDSSSFFRDSFDRMNFCNSNYDFVFVGSGLKVSLDSIRMMDHFSGGDYYKISFPVDFKFKYDHENLINLEEC